VNEDYVRRIAIRPAPGVIEAEMEDYPHHFSLRIEHADGVVTAAEATGHRIPWTSCANGAAGLRLLAGTALADATKLDAWAPDRATQCVHVADLALLAVRHAYDDAPTNYEARLSPGAAPDRVATLRENGDVVLTWHLDEHDVVAELGIALARAPFFALMRERGMTGRDLERAVVLRRACHIGRSRGVDLDAFATAADIHDADHSCFTYRPDVASRALRVVGSTRATEED
jgi:hypothetical protein